MNRAELAKHPLAFSVAIPDPPATLNADTKVLWPITVADLSWEPGAVEAVQTPNPQH